VKHDSVVALLAFGAEKGDGYGPGQARSAPAKQGSGLFGEKGVRLFGRGGGHRGHPGLPGLRSTRMEHAGKPEGKSILGDRGHVRVRVLKIRSPISGRPPAIPDSQHPRASAGHCCRAGTAACGLELAENVRLNNFLPTAVSDALQIAGLSDIDLLQDGILPFLLP